MTAALLAGACGYSSDATRSAPAAVPAAAEDPPKSGDHELDHLRWLAVKAPLDELFARALPFLGTRVRVYKTDVFLWRGVERLAREIVDNPNRRVDRPIIGVLVAQIGGIARPETPDLRDLLPALRVRLNEGRPAK